MSKIISEYLFSFAKTMLSNKRVLTTAGRAQILHKFENCKFTKKTHSNACKENPVPCIDLIQFHGIWPCHERKQFIRDMRVIPDFISATEESQLIEEIEPYVKRLRYEYDHWDDAIHGFRETERKRWYPENRQVLDRVCQVAFMGEAMPYVHILDLAEQGVIKPHVDSSRYCGNTISGISLLTPCVMRLVRVDEKKYIQSAQGMKKSTYEHPQPEYAAYRSQPKTTLEDNFYADLLLPRKSLYIMSNSARYNFTHEVLSNEAAIFQGQLIRKSRRISIICRNDPHGGPTSGSDVSAS